MTIVLFVLTRMAEKCRSKTKKLFFVLVDLETTFDWLLVGVISFALWRKGITKYLVGIMSLCKGCKTTVLVEGELSNSFSVTVGVHQGSALSPI